MGKTQRILIAVGGGIWGLVFPFALLGGLELLGRLLFN